MPSPRALPRRRTGALLTAVLAVTGASTVTAPSTSAATTVSTTPGTTGTTAIPDGSSANNAVQTRTSASRSASTSASTSAEPAVQVTTVVSGLANPWDLTWVGDLLLFDERAGQLSSKRGSAAPQRVTVSGFPTVYAQGEAGLLGLVADPAAASNGRFYTCQAVSSGGAPLDVRVLRWRLTSDTTAMADGSDNRVVTGIPLSSGRHSGCRLRFGPDGLLYVGTGDAAIGTNPQNLASLGGKVLRVRGDGSVPTDNPFYVRGGNARYVWTFGHRNVQGLAARPGTGELWSVEHGTARDDEVNLLARGGNYGWDPVPGYDESTPMTDLAKFPTARVARWSSGAPTVATSGASFVTGSAWGVWQGALAVGLLKGQGLYLMRLAPTPATERVVAAQRMPVAEGFGRIRAVQSGPDGSLWFTTSNGVNDRIVKVTPTATPPALRAGQLVSTAGVTAARTGSAIMAFVRSTGDRVYFRRSTDDGRTWSGWADAGVTSSNPPSAASTAAGRVTLMTRTPSGSVLHSWFVNGIRQGSKDLGGSVLAQHTSSVGDGTLDVFAVSPDGGGWRNHLSGGRWSGWRPVGGVFTSGLSASADLSTRVTTVTGRGTDGATYERPFTAASAGSGWVRQAELTSGWSDRALGDVVAGGTGGSGRVAVSSGPDRSAVVERGRLVLGVPGVYTSALDVVTRPDGTFLLVGRGSDGALWINDARPGGYANRSLGGVVR